MKARFVSANKMRLICDYGARRLRRGERERRLRSKFACCEDLSGAIDESLVESGFVDSAPAFFDSQYIDSYGAV
jgi:hypothetical protein